MASLSDEHLLKDTQLAVEYKHLQTNAPGGVFVFPSTTDMRRWHGVIFVRRGVYANAIFKFLIELPPAYNAVGCWPKVTFVRGGATSDAGSPIVFNPHVSADTQELDVRASFPEGAEWDPTTNFVVAVLTFLKKCFYDKCFDGFGDGDGARQCANPVALALFRENKPEYLRHVEACVAASAARCYDTDATCPGATMTFSKARPSHRLLADALLGRADDGTATPPGSASEERDPVLAVIDRVRRAG